METSGYEKVSFLSGSISGHASNNSTFNKQVESSNLLEDIDWYWGSITKEEASIKLMDKKDGFFLVRNSRNPGEYTLTVRKNSANRLIRIFCINGKYGLNNPAKFDSVIDLIEYYRRHSLAEFNIKLDINLKYPLSRISHMMDSEKIILLLNNLSEEIKLKNELFKKIELEFSFNSNTYDEINVVFESQVLLTDLLKEHNSCMKTFIKSGVFPEIISQNKIVFESLLITEQKKLSEFDCKLDFQRSRYTEYQTKLSLLRGELNSLLNQREEYKSWLVENGIPQNELDANLSEFNLDEEIYGSNVETLNMLQSNKSLSSRKKDLDTLIPKKFSTNSWLANENLNRLDAQKKFIDKGNIDGSFIVRTSKSPKSPDHLYTLELMYKDKVYRIKILNKLGFYQLEVGPGFQCLEELINYYTIHSFKEYLHSLDILLKHPLL